MDFNVIQLDGTDVSLESGISPGKTSGILALVQEVLIELLSDQIPERARGAGLRSILINSDPRFEEVVPQQVQQAIEIAKTHIFANQREAVGINDNERLADVELLNIEKDGTLWRVDLRIINRATEAIEISTSQ